MVIYLFLLLPILVVAVVSLNDAPSLAFPPTRISLRWFGAFLTSADFGRADAHQPGSGGGDGPGRALPRYGGRLRARPLPGAGRSLVLQFLTSPLILPGIVVALALLQLYAQLGVTPSEASLVAGHVVVALPYAVRTMHAAFATYDTTLDDAAATLGARPLRTFFRVTLPVIKPSLVAGGVFTFAISFSNIMVSVFLIGPGTTTLPVRMYNYIEFSNDPTIAAISTVVVLATFLAVWVLHRTVGLGGFFR